MTVLSSLVTMLSLIGIVFLTSYLALRPHFADWSIRGSHYEERFETFEKDWPRIFATAGGVASITAILTFFIADNNLYAGFIIGAILGLLGIAAYTDMRVYKVPLELSKWTVKISIAVFVAFILSGASIKLPMLYSTFYPSFSWGNFWGFAGVNFVLALVGFLLAVKSRGRVLFLLSLLMMFTGVYLIGYALISSIGSGLMMNENIDPIWGQMMRTVLVAYVFLGVAAGYDLFLPRNGIGGADTLIFYTLGFAFAWWVSPYMLFVALLVAFTLQLVMHGVAGRLDIGYVKETRNGPIRQAIVNSKAKKQGIVATTTHEARAVPFVPVLVFGVLGTIIITLGVVA